MDLQTHIDEFAARDGNGAFPRLARADVAEGLRRRIENPISLDQGAATFSGPAAFLYCLLKDRPELYLQYVIELYERGQTSLDALEIVPSEGCREAAPPADRIAAVDWIALASLRDSEMTVADFGIADDTGLPATEPARLAEWLTAAGYLQVWNDADRFFNKGPRETAHLRSLYMQGRRICVFISADMLIGPGDRTQTLRPNQWSVLASPVMLTLHGLTLDLYQWGAIRRVPPTGNLHLDRFCRNFYGFIAATPPPRSAAALTAAAARLR